MGECPPPVRNEPKKMYMQATRVKAKGAIAQYCKRVLRCLVCLGAMCLEVMEPKKERKGREFFGDVRFSVLRSYRA